MGKTSWSDMDISGELTELDACSLKKHSSSFHPNLMFNFSKTRIFWKFEHFGNFWTFWAFVPEDPRNEISKPIAYKRTQCHTVVRRIVSRTAFRDWFQRMGLNDLFYPHRLVFEDVFHSPLHWRRPLKSNLKHCMGLARFSHQLPSNISFRELFQKMVLEIVAENLSSTSVFEISFGGSSFWIYLFCDQSLEAVLQNLSSSWQVSRADFYCGYTIQYYTGLCKLCSFARRFMEKYRCARADKKAE